MAKPLNFSLGNCKLLEIEVTDHGRIVSTSPMQMIIPRRRFTATSYAEVRDAFNNYRAELEATGQPATVWVTADPCNGQRRWRDMEINIKAIEFNKKFVNPPPIKDTRTKHQVAA